MSIEAALAENTSAIRELIETIRLGRQMAKPTATEEASADQPTSSSSPVVTQEQVDRALLAYAKAHGRPAAVALLEQFGAANSKQIVEADRAKFLEAAQ